MQRAPVRAAVPPPPVIQRQIAPHVHRAQVHPPPAPAAQRAAAVQAAPVVPRVPRIHPAPAAHVAPAAASPAKRAPAWAPPVVQPCRKRKYEGDDKQKKPRKKRKTDDDQDYVAPWEKAKFRKGIPVRIRQKVIKRTALKHPNGHYVCPNCYRPIADKNLKEIKFRYRSKTKKVVHSVSLTAMDHHDPDDPRKGKWSIRLEGLLKRGASKEEIEREYLDHRKLRALCKKCNEKHALEGKDIENTDSDVEDYFTDSEEEDLNQGLFKNFRDPPPPGGSAGSLVV